MSELKVESKTKRAQYESFTGMGVIRLKGIPAKLVETKTEKGSFDDIEAGAPLIEAAAVISDRKYDWTNKISMALMPLEVSQILMVGDTRFPTLNEGKTENGKVIYPAIKLFHDKGKGGPTEGQIVKTLSIQAADSTKNVGTKSYGFFLTEKGQGKDRKINIYLSHIEFFAFQRELARVYDLCREVTK
jgi:hypothetical protein